ncbi:MAG TPA: histidine ammonia-lyase [Acidobacteriaceae bacterium]|nr:histidine ammonia-lyase [Acidobacteriaceae bacterium]
MSSSPLALNGEPLTLEELAAAAYGNVAVVLHPEARQRMQASRAVVDRYLAEGATVYGINTGFGKMSEVSIPADQLADLQLNLVRSHACGVGQSLSEAEIRGMLLLRANVLAKGTSGVRVLVAEHLLNMLEKNICPVVPARGSVGASGDLAPLAHLALGMIGEGEVFYQGERMGAQQALGAAGMEPLRLAPKEGLALLNGTQAMAAVGGLALLRAERVVRLADLAGAMTLEALKGTPTAFDARIHAVRPHPGQVGVARHLRSLLAQSEIRESHREHDPRVQDAYCLRCMPQVHGAVLDGLAHGRRVLEIEMGSATDNPLVFVAETKPESTEVAILSGGNFHGAPLAYVFDYAAIAMTDLMSICERRIDRLVNPDLNEGLPPFLTPHAGVSSGYMVAHVAAAALLAEARVLAHPSSVDSVPTSGGKEDHVSMGMTAAWKLRQIVENAESVLAIELMSAAEGLEYRRPLKPAKRVEAAWNQVRGVVAKLERDRSLQPDISNLRAAMLGGMFDAWMH